MLVSPERVTVNVNGVLPVLPSALLAPVAAIANDRRVVINDGAACGSGGDGGASARPRQRDSKTLVGLHRGVAGDVDGDELAGLAGGEADRPAGKVLPVKSAASAALAPLPVTV